LGLPHHDQQRRAARHVIEKGLSVRATEALVRKSLGTESQSPARKATNSVDPNVRAAETRLRRTLGAQVRIIQGTTDGPGRIEIAFFNNQDLDRVYRTLVRLSDDM
jgi:ParB family chromosome partitioning protein